MNRLRGATGVTITVLGTLVIAAVAYGGTSGRLHPAAALVSPSASPQPPGMTVVPTPPITAPTGFVVIDQDLLDPSTGDRESTRLNSSHGYISYAVFCLKKKKT